MARCSVPFFIIIRIFFCLFLYISFEEDPTAQRPRKEETPLDGNGILAFFQGILGQMQPCCQLQEQRRLRFCFLPLFTPKFPLGFAYLEVGGTFSPGFSHTFARGLIYRRHYRSFEVSFPFGLSLQHGRNISSAICTGKDCNCGFQSDIKISIL